MKKAIVWKSVAVFAVILCLGTFIYAADKDIYTAEGVLNLAWSETNSRFEVYVTGTAGPTVTTQIRDYVQVSGALDRTTAVAAQWRPQQIVLHASGAVVEACTVKFVSLSSGNPETLIATISAGWTDAYVTLPSPLYNSGDEIRVECANSGAATIDVDISGEGA